MSDQQSNQQEEFGIDSNTTSKSRVNFRAGFTKSYLTEVKAEEIGKKAEKFFVLNFNFIDEENNRSFRHTEFIPKGKAGKKTEAEDYTEKRQRLNSRIKHLWEAFAVFTDASIPKAKNWNEFFTNIATAFNTGNDGQPIYKGIKVWLKTTYNDKNDLQLPLLPNFIERIGTKNEQRPETLEINLKYDKTEQDKKPSAGGPGVMGGGSSGGSSASGDFF